MDIEAALLNLLNPGIHIERRKDVPLYWIEGEQMVCELNGKLYNAAYDETSKKILLSVRE